MAFKKLLFLTCLSLISPLSIQAELLTQETNIRYDIDYDINWFKKFIIRIAGYDFLDWEELNIQTTFQKNNITGEEKISAMQITTDNPQRIVLSMTNDGGIVKGFIEIKKNKEFPKENAEVLLNAWNYLYQESEQNFEIHIASGLFVNDDGSMHCKFTKNKSKEKYQVNGRTYNKDGDENGYIDVIFNKSPELQIQEIKAKISAGEITLIKK